MKGEEGTTGLPRTWSFDERVGDEFAAFSGKSLWKP